MADVSSPIPMGTKPEGHNWLVIIGAVAGVAGLFLLLKNQSNSGTVAAGSSINASLGSIQEEVLNAQGTLSQQAAYYQGQNAAMGNQIYNNVSAQGNELYNEVQGISQQNANLAGQISSVQGAVGQTYQQAAEGNTYSSIAAMATDPVDTQSYNHVLSANTGSF